MSARRRNRATLRSSLETIQEGGSLYHAVLFRVSRPGRVARCPGGRVLAKRPLSGTALGGNAPAHPADCGPASASASSAWSLCALAGGSRKCVLRYLRHRVAPACFGRRSHG